MDIKKLQKEFIEIIALIPITKGENELKKQKERALEIISKLKDHKLLNDEIECSCRKMTALSYVIYFDSIGCSNVDGVKKIFVIGKVNGEEKIYEVWRSGSVEKEVKRLKNETLLELEAAIRKAGGRLYKPKSFLAKLPLYAMFPTVALDLLHNFSHQLPIVNSSNQIEP